MLTARLNAELDHLRASYKVEVIEEGDIIDVILHNFETSPLFNHPETSLLLRIPKSYPDAGLDMFWTSVDLLLADGSVPSAADSIETYAARNWRRFSWHHTAWNPVLHNLATYLTFVRRRFNAR